MDDIDTQMNRIARLPEVSQLTGLSRSTIYARVEDGLLTQPVQIGPQAVGWPLREIGALNDARIAGKTDDEIRELVVRLETERTGKTATPRRKGHRMAQINDLEIRWIKGEAELGNENMRLQYRIKHNNDTWSDWMLVPIVTVPLIAA